MSKIKSTDFFSVLFAFFLSKVYNNLLSPMKIQKYLHIFYIKLIGIEGFLNLLGCTSSRP